MSHASSSILLARLVAVTGVLVASLAQADLVAGVNDARLRDCATEYQRPLHRSVALDTAARQLARGASLHEALKSASYRAANASSIHLLVAPDESAVAHMLARRYCKDIVQPGLAEYGGAARGQELWLVVAAPVVVPSPADARAEEQRVLALVNAARGRSRRCGTEVLPAAGPLALEPSLTAAALSHSRDMAKNSRFEHVGVDGSTASDRVRRTGYAARVVGENLAAGVVSGREAMDGWLASPPHCANLMDGHYTAMGVAFASNLASTSAVYWTQVFAAPR
jgi:uncharacterized protein YkwD